MRKADPVNAAATLSRSFFCKAFVVTALCAAVTLGISTKASAASGESAALQADHSLTDAAAKGSKAAVASLLDKDFAWTNAKGKTRTQAETLDALSDFAMDNQGDTDTQTHDFGEVERIVGTHHGDRFVRIWVKRPQGWRALIVLDTPIPPNGYSNHPSPPRAADKNCTNPCKDLPFTPANAAQKAAMDAWLTLKMDEWHAVKTDWPKHVSETMLTISPGMYMTKEQRYDLLAKQYDAYGDGSPSAPVKSMKMFDFGKTVIMTALHGPNAAGKPSYAVRMFVDEGGTWKIALSAQTNIE